jgi:hypothetical protein
LLVCRAKEVRDMKIARLVIAPGLALLMVGHLARADEASRRVFATMDRVGSDSQIGLDAAYTHFSFDEVLDDIHTLRFDLYGRYVHPSGFGVTFAMPLTSAWAADENDTAIGNLSIGGLYTARRGPAELFARAGLVLPTADDENGGYNVLGTYGRLADIMTGVPDATTLQLSLSPQITRGRLFARADFGLDVVVVEPDDVDDLGPFAHVSGAAGVDTGPVALAAELVNEVDLSLIGDEGQDSTIHTFGLSACACSDRVRPHVGVAVPFGDDISDFVDVVFLAGVSGTLDL